MKTKLFAVLAWTLVCALNSPLSTAFAQGTAFTYQGQLQNNGSPASGSYDLTFTPFNVASSGSAVAGPLTNSATGVTNGLFTATLNFGSGVFNGTSYWLEIGVRTNGGNGFTTLAPRQQVTPTPYAIYAEGVNAAGLSGSIPTASLSGTYSGALTLNNPANSFAGNGASVSNVNAATLGGLTPANFWQTTGNAGTTAGVNFVGTTDNQPLELHVNGTRAFRIEPGANGNPSVVNVIGGSANTVAGTAGATIGGGHLNTNYNIYATIGGGTLNVAAGPGSFIGGGGFDGSTYSGNLIFGPAGAATVGGGIGNGAYAQWATVGGGAFNGNNGAAGTIAGGLSNSIYAGYAAVGGGAFNFAWGVAGTIAGGLNNSVNDANYATVGGGAFNTASGTGSFIGGGGTEGIDFSSYDGNSASGTASTIGGGMQNNASGAGSFIGGGGWDGFNVYGNTASGYASAIGGGIINVASGPYSAVLGGEGNQATNFYATIAGGFDNMAAGESAAVGGGSLNQATGVGSFVGGGGLTSIGNTAGNTSSGAASTVGGGMQNVASGVGSFVGGGGVDGSLTPAGNTASGPASTVAGGYGNTILSGGTYAFIGGGSGNIASGADSFVGGGNGNQASGPGSFVGGGGTAGNNGPPCCGGGGGQPNTASSAFATVGGGLGNTASGMYSTVPGGATNTASGQSSFAAGQDATARDNNSFVWSDGTRGAVSQGSNSFAVLATGGAYFYTTTSGVNVEVDPTGDVDFGTTTRQMLNLYSSTYGIGVQTDDEYFRTGDQFYWYEGGTANNNNGNSGGGTTLMSLGATGNLILAGTLTQNSDRNVKSGFQPVDARQVLEKIATMPVSRWHYTNNVTAAHIGPMAQDFYAAFALGEDDKHITTVDEGGVALAAIQGLNQKVEQQHIAVEQQIKEKDAEIQDLKQSVARLEKMVQLLADKQ